MKVQVKKLGGKVPCDECGDTSKIFLTLYLLLQYLQVLRMVLLLGISEEVPELRLLRPSYQKLPPRTRLIVQRRNDVEIKNMSNGNNVNVDEYESLIEEIKQKRRNHAGCCDVPISEKELIV